MAEWWNLDQVMIWAQARDPELIALAEGDAAGHKPRQLSFVDVMLTGDEDEPEEPHTGLSMAGLVDMLSAGKLIARDADDEATPYPLDIPFSNYHCVIAGEDNGPDPYLALRSAAYPFRWRHILITAESARLQFPPKAPDEMQAELATLHETLSRKPLKAIEPIASAPSRPRRLTKTDRAKQAIAELYPEGLASADDPRGRQSMQIRRVIAKVGKLPDGRELDEGVVRYAAGLKQIRKKT